MKANQQGLTPIFAFIIFSAVIMSSVMASKLISIKLESPKKIPIETSRLYPSPSIEPVIPSPKEAPALQHVFTTSPNETTPAPSDSRGKIVSHFDWCKRESNSVYENELVKYTSKTGVEMLVTKDDIKCLEASLGTNAPQANSNSQCQDNVNAIFYGKMWDCERDRNPSLCRFSVSQQRLGYLSNCEGN